MDRVRQLFALGQSVWLDYIRRGHVASGEFASLVKDRGVVGVTSNPTIFQLAIGDSHDYDEAIQRHIAKGLEGQALFEALALEDIRAACDVLHPVFLDTVGRDGRVSLEVDPRLARDTGASIAEARRLHRAVGRDNVMIKIPATREGLPAIDTLIAEGICVNVTLIFSIARYEEVMDAYLRGLETRLDGDQPLAPMVSVASFFVSRVDTKVDGAIEQRLATLPAAAPERATLASLRGKAAISNARLAYQRFLEVFASPRFEKLRARGARVQRPLWASTSTKNPAYPDTLYVDELIGRDTVNTMPLATLDAYEDHGALEVMIEHDLEGARALFRRLPELGVPIEDLIAQLEPEGVTAFAKSYDALLGALESKRREMVGAGDSQR